MTISTLDVRINYTGNGTQDTFAFNFAAYDPAWVMGSVDGVSTFGLHTVLNPDQQANPGGTFRFDDPPPLGSSVVVYRSTHINQLTDYPPFTRFPSKDHEEALDKLTMISQEIDQQGRDNTIAIELNSARIDQNTLDIAQNAFDISINAANISALQDDIAGFQADVINLENDKADKSIAVISDDPDTITILNPTLEDDVTLQVRTNQPNALAKLDGDGLLPPSLVPPFEGTGDFRSDGSVAMSGSFRMDVGAGFPSMRAWGDSGGFELAGDSMGFILREINDSGVGGAPSIIFFDGFIQMMAQGQVKLNIIPDGIDVLGTVYSRERFALAAPNPNFENFVIERGGSGQLLVSNLSSQSMIFQGENFTGLEDILTLRAGLFAPDLPNAEARTIAVSYGGAADLSGHVAPLVIGTNNPANDPHLAIGNTGLQSKQTGNAAKNLNLNAHGGPVTIGSLDGSRIFLPGFVPGPAPSPIQFTIENELMLEVRGVNAGVAAKAGGGASGLGRVVTVADAVGIGSTNYRPITSNFTISSAVAMQPPGWELGTQAGQIYAIDATLYIEHPISGGGGYAITLNTQSGGSLCAQLIAAQHAETERTAHIRAVADSSTLNYSRAVSSLSQSRSVIRITGTVVAGSQLLRLRVSLQTASDVTEDSILLAGSSFKTTRIANA